MPIHTCTDTPYVVDAIWIFIPNEVIDFSKFTVIRSLLIECYGPTQQHPPTTLTPSCLLGHRLPFSAMKCSGHVDIFRCLTSSKVYPDNEPFTLPSLRVFPFLQRVIIQNIHDTEYNKTKVYIKALTYLPPTLTILELHNTLIEDIGLLVHQCPNLLQLRLENNSFPIKNLAFPQSLYKLSAICETFTNELRIPTNTCVVSLIHSTFPRLHFDHNPNTATQYRYERLIIAGCISPYDELIVSKNTINFAQKVCYIMRTNGCSIYTDFGSIPKRIRIRYVQDNENPIIVALNLSSNYPRRMAEFMALIY